MIPRAVEAGTDTATSAAAGATYDYNAGRPQEALAWNRAHDVHAGLADALVPNFPEPEILPTA